MKDTLINLFELLLLLGHHMLILAGDYWGGVLIALLFWNVVVFLIYGRDKVLAENGEWRIPERVLLQYAFLFASPGALLSCRLFRHKVSKAKFFSSLQRIAAFHILCIIALAYYYAQPFAA